MSMQKESTHGSCLQIFLFRHRLSCKTKTTTEKFIHIAVLNKITEFVVIHWRFKVLKNNADFLKVAFKLLTFF